jgi:hypothetical protein
MYMPGQPPNGQRFMPAMGMPPGMNPMGGPMPGMPKGQMSNGMEYGVSVTRVKPLFFFETYLVSLVLQSWHGWSNDDA